MKQAAYLPADIFAGAFPFYFALDTQLKITGYGKSLALAFPGMATGDAFNQHLTVMRPHLALSAAALREHPHLLFLLRASHSDLQLRGQFVSPDDETLLFLGGPWVADVEALKRFNLSLTDFPLHDATADMLQLIQHEKMALNEARLIADRLKEKRALLQGILSAAPDAIITVDHTAMLST